MTQTTQATQIVDVPALVAKLPADRRARFERLFDMQLETGHCIVPDDMRDWVVRRFGSIAEVETQRVLRITNQITWEGAAFNPLRARRPLHKRPPAAPFHSDEPNLFADPLRKTTDDVFGRVVGAHCVTSSNLARWDGQCAVLIFDEPNPLVVTAERMQDYFRTALRWAERAHQADPEARYFIWMWNGGPAGGASIPHAHAQLGLARGRHYAGVERLRRTALGYRHHHHANYFDDLLAAHSDVGLSFKVNGLAGFVSLTPLRGKDTWIIGRAFDDQLAVGLASVLRALIERADMQAFDVAVLMPPLFGPHTEDWTGFPTIARIVDRGQSDALSSDIGALDLFAQAVIMHDPYWVKRMLDGALR
ncbi:MAG: hypothetical protein RMN25_10220 [Anaerolineae bacterium]|nr:hypothetical protein [Thermoflexales bacterium]MDW8408143.1 hypothetical protein [Anaerolineae bacterium]